MLRSFRRFQHKTFRWCFADNQMSNFTNGSAFCIDLIFASNTSYVTTGIKHSIWDKCHHIIYGKLDFDIHIPPSYYRKIWEYKKTNTEAIQTAIPVGYGFPK